MSAIEDGFNGTGLRPTQTLQPSAFPVADVDFSHHRGIRRADPLLEDHRRIQEQSRAERVDCLRPGHGHPAGRASGDPVVPGSPMGQFIPAQ